MARKGQLTSVDFMYQQRFRSGGTDIVVSLLFYQVGAFSPNVVEIVIGQFIGKVGELKESHKRYILPLNAFFGSKYLSVSSFAGIWMQVFFTDGSAERGTRCLFCTNHTHCLVLEFLVPVSLT